MGNNDSTIFEQKQTDNTLNTVLEADSTIAETNHTGRTTNDSNNSFSDANIPIEKGSTILELYNVESEPIMGGMGQVFRVHHMGWNVDLAMKQPKRELFQTEKQKENFVKECEHWINLGLHLHIVSCYYVREIDGIPSIFSEWMNGGSLKNFIENGKLYAGGEKEILRRILDISIQFARGLHYAHEQQLIHQDVKPDNVLLTDRGIVKVTDFGIANAKIMLEAEETGEKSVTGTIISDSGAYTPAYRSPEQAKGEKLTRRTDIWSWAVSVLEMFVGERLWQDGVVAGLACEDYFSTERTGMPEALKDLLRHCFHENEADRPHDFKEIEDILLKIYRQSTGEAYHRPEPKAAAETADSLNNRALSFLDLEKPEDAYKCWKQALETNPEHIESLYNRTVNLWKTGEIDDVEAIHTLEVSMANADYYVAKLHMARGDAQNAIVCLKKAVEIHGETDEIKKAIDIAQGMIRDEKDGQCIYEWEAKYLYEASKEWKRSFMKADVFNSVCFSPNGRKVLSGGKALLRLWNIDTKEYIYSFEEHSNTAVCFSPDNSKIIAGCGDRTLRLWNINTGEYLRSFEGHRSSIIAVSFNHNSTKILSGDEHTIKLWDANTGKCIHSIENERISTVCFSPDGSKALSANDQALKLWDMNTGICIRSFEESDTQISVACFSPDGRKALTVSNRTLKLWDITTGKCIKTFKANTYSIKSACFSSDGSKILSGGGRNEKGVVKLWDIPAGRCIRTFEGHRWAIRTVSYSPDGKHALSACGYEDTFMKLWRLPETFHIETILSKIHSTEKVAEQELLFNRLIAEIDTFIKNKNISEAVRKLEEARGIQLFGKTDTYYEIKKKLSRFCIRKNVIANQMPHIITCNSNVETICFDPAGKHILCGESSGKLTLFDITGEQIKTFEGHKGKVTAACFNSDGVEILSGSSDEITKLWETKSGKCLYSFEGHNNPIDAVCFSPNDHMAVSGSVGAVAVWGVNSKNCVQVLKSDNTYKPNSIYFNLYGDRIIVGYDLKDKDSQALKLWDLLSGECIHTFDYKDSSNCSALSPDGTTIVSGTNSKAGNRIMLWDVATKKCIAEFSSESESKSICFSPDGKYVVSGGGKYAKLWDIDTKKCIQTFEMTDVNAMSPVKSVCFSQDNTKIAMTNGKEVLIYDLDYDIYFPGWNDWDEGAEPYLNLFLRLYQDWPVDEIKNILIPVLQNRGYGWLSPKGIEEKLEEIKEGGHQSTTDRQGNKRSFWKKLFTKN